MPDAAPAICGSTLRMATVVIGANTQPMPTPGDGQRGRKSYHWDVVVA